MHMSMNKRVETHVGKSNSSLGRDEDVALERIVHPSVKDEDNELTG